MILLNDHGIHDKKLFGIQLHPELYILFSAAVPYIITVQSLYKLIHIELSELIL